MNKGFLLTPLFLIILFSACQTTTKQAEKVDDGTLSYQGKTATNADMDTVEIYSRDLITHLNSLNAVFGGDTEALLFDEYLLHEIIVFVIDESGSYSGVTLPFQMLPLAKKEYVHESRIVVRPLSDISQEERIMIDLIFGEITHPKDIVTIAFDPQNEKRSFFIWSFIEGKWRIKAMDGNEEKISFN